MGENNWPKCERCEGKAFSYDVINPGGREVWEMGSMQHPCPVCNGTGERDLTVDEAAEYLDANSMRWTFESNITDAAINYLIQVHLLELDVLYIRKGTTKLKREEAVVSEELFKSVLNAAAREVRKVGK